MSKQRKTESYEVKLSVTTLTKCMVIVGIILIILSMVLKGDGGDILSFIKKCCEIIGTTLFSAGLVSVVVEISTIKNLVQVAFKDVLNAEFPLDAYSEERMKKLGIDLARKRCKNTMSDETFCNSVYKMESELLNLVDGLYLEYHNAKYIVKPNDEKNTFIKKVSVDYKVINKFNLENKVEFNLCLFDSEEGMRDSDRKKAFILNKFMVNETDLLAEKDKCIRIEPIPKKAHSTYTYRLFFTRELQKCKEHKVVLEYEYEIPQSDVTQTYKISTPCKRLSHEILIDEKKSISNWRITPSAFTSFYCNQNESDGGFLLFRH